MYQISNATKRNKVNAALSAPSREFSNRISFGYYDTTQSKPYPFITQHTVCELAECSIEQSVCAGDKLTMGGACSSSLKATFTAREATVNGEDKTATTANFITSYSYKDKVAFVECGIKYDYDSTNDKDLYFYIPMGYYVIKEAESENDWQTVSITGYDYIGSVMDDQKNLFNLNSTDLSLAVYNLMDAQSVLRKIAENFGIKWWGRTDSLGYWWNKQQSSYSKRYLTSDEASTLQGLTWREALSRLCGLLGCAARIDTQGRLTAKFYDYPDQTYYRVNIPQNSQYQDGFKKLSENTFTISSITSNNNGGTSSDSTYTAGNGTGISFTNPLITNDDIDGILTGINAYSAQSGNYDLTVFQPCEVLWRGNPCVEAGDIVTVTYKSVDYRVFVAKQTIDLVGGLSMKITCPNADNEVRYDTGDWVTNQELASNISSVRSELAAATAAINGSQGGYIQINDTDDPPDGNPDEILITQVEGGATGNVVKLNQNGMLLGTNGIGGSFNVAITGSGINASVINSGIINADLIQSGSINASLIQSGVLNGELIQSGSITADKMDIGGLVDNDLPNFSFLSSGNRLSNWDTGFKLISNTPTVNFCYASDYGTEHSKAYYFKIVNTEAIKQQREYWADLLLHCPEGVIGDEYCFTFTPIWDGDDFEDTNEITVGLYVISDDNKTYNESRFAGLAVTTDENEQSVTATYNRVRVRRYTTPKKTLTIKADGVGKKHRIRFTLPQYGILEHEYFLISIDVKAHGKSTACYYGVKDLAIGKYVEGETVIAGKIKSYTEDTYIDLDEATLYLTEPLDIAAGNSEQRQNIQTYDYLKFTKTGENNDYGMFSQSGVELYDYASNGTKNGYLSFTDATSKGVAIVSTGSQGGNIVLGGSYSPYRVRSFDYNKYNREYDGGEFVSGNIYCEFYNGEFIMNCKSYFWGDAAFKNDATFDDSVTFNYYPTFNATATFNYGIKSDSIMVDYGNYTALLYQSGTIFLGNSNKDVQIDANSLATISKIQMGSYMLEAKSDGLYYGNNRLCFYAERNNP